MFPIFFSFFVVLVHNSIANGCPRRHDVTRENIFVGTVYSFHESYCRGNNVLNVCRKGLLVFVNLESVKDLDAKSAILFWLPSMCVVNSGDTCITCCLMASALSKCAAVIDVVVVCLFVQVTVAWLSQNMPIWVCCRLLLTIFSRISQAKRTPAISRSVIDIAPFGFFFDTRFV